MTPGLDRLWARLRAMFSHREWDDDFNAELEHHLEALTADNIKSGMSPQEARRQAHLALGGMEQARELHRETRGVPWLEQFVRDISYAGRVLRRERGFAVVAILILAIGIGLNATVFSLVNTVILRPLPFVDADQLVMIANGDAGNPINHSDLSRIASMVDTWEALQERTQALERIEAFDPFSVRQTFRLTSNTGEPETVLAVQVSPGLFPMLGMKPLYGRLLLPEDATADAPLRTVLTYQLWSRRFNRDPAIVGRTIQINNEPVEVVGVLPPADPFTTAFFPAVRVDGYVPVVKEHSRDWGNTLMLIGRAKPGVTPGQAAADTSRALDQYKQQLTEPRYMYANVFPLQEWVAGSLRQPLTFLWIAAGLVLAIVGFNLGGLLLARGANRGRELAVRVALGASRFRIARQLLTECFALVAVGTLLGGLLAWGCILLLAKRTAVEIPLLQNVRLDTTALGFTVLLCLLTVLLCGLAPAWKLSRDVDLQNALKDEGRASTGGRAQSRTRSALVVLEVALACVLAISAGLMVRSLMRLLRVDLGFAPQNLIAVRVDPVVDGKWDATVAYLETLLDHVRALPAVQAAGLTDCIPVERDRSWGLFPVNPDSAAEQRWTDAHVRIVSPGLVGAIGTPLIAGRDFTRADKDGGQRVMLINRTLAEWCWPGETAVGRQINLGGRGPVAVIGVVADVRHSGPEMPSGNEIYLPLRQMASGSWDLLVRTSLPVSALTADLRGALRDVDASLPLTKVRPMSELVDRTLSSRRLLVSLIGGFAGVALGLAALGLYGLISYSVTQRTREIGIRMALGADAAIVRRSVLLDTLKLAMAGLALGVAGSLAAAHLLQSLLFGVSAMDVPTYVLMGCGALACAFVAGYLPARRASRVDPMIALRAE